MATQRTPFDWAYKTKRSNRSCKASRNGCSLSRGKMLGGNGAMNQMLYVRGNEQDFQDWPTNTNTWNWNDVLPYYKKSISDPMKIEPFPNHTESLTQVLLDAGAEKGHMRQIDSNGLGYSLVHGTVSNGVRVTAAKAHLMQVKPNLRIIKMAIVTKINLDKQGQTTGVEFLYNGTNSMTVKSTKEVILTAGPIGNPKLLMHSGIGPKDTLTKLEIPVVKHLPVGKHLQDIVTVPLYFQFHASTAAPISKSELLDNIYLYAVNRTGNLAGHGISNLVAHWSTISNTERPNIQITHKYFSTNAFDLQFYLAISGYAEMIGRQILDNNQRSEILVLNVGLMRPKSTGAVKIISSDPSAHPKVYTKYLEHADDVATMVQALKHAASFVDTKEFQKHEGKLVRMPLADCKSMEYLSDAYWSCYLTYMSQSSGRQYGTTRMGDDVTKSVVNDRLTVHGVDSLRVVGSSVVPTSVGGQSNSATLMVAERAADFVKDDWSGGEQRVEL